RRQVPREAVAVAGHRVVDDQQLVRVRRDEPRLQGNPVQGGEEDIFVLHPVVAGTPEYRGAGTRLEQVGVLLDHRVEFVRDRGRIAFSGVAHGVEQAGRANASKSTSSCWAMISE